MDASRSATIYTRDDTSAQQLGYPNMCAQPSVIL